MLKSRWLRRLYQLALTAITILRFEGAGAMLKRSRRWLQGERRYYSEKAAEADESLTGIRDAAGSFLGRSGIQVDRAVWRNAGFEIKGWVLWRHHDEPLTAHFSLDGQPIGEGRCNLSRPEVALRISPDFESYCRGFYFSRPLMPAELTPPIETGHLQIEIMDAVGRKLQRTQPIQYVGASADGQLWSQLENAIAHFQDVTDREPSILDWDTKLELRKKYPLRMIFSPPEVTSPLPYADESVDLVILADDTYNHEARRVAAGGVITMGTDAISVAWKLPPKQSHNRASIIIPVYNKLEFTRPCLEQIRKTLTPDFEGEVMVVDDGSTDGSLEMLNRMADEWPCLRVIHQAQNAGFIRSCNLGAKSAANDILVFLNNDTLPQAGWFAAIMGTFARYADAGAVGGKLLRGGGILAEAGSVVFADGTCDNIGRDDYRVDYPLYTSVREVDYCSGALLATRRDLFLELGGFDQLYEPAYYEDVDYCFKVRAKGLKVYFQPESVVTHFEGVSYSKDPAQGISPHQIANRQKFVDRWPSILANQPTPAPKVDLKRLIEWTSRERNGESVKRVFVFSPDVPVLDRDSGLRRTFQLIEMLQAVGWTVFVLVQNVTRQRDARELRQRGIVLYSGLLSQDAGDDYLPNPAPLIEAAQFDLAILTYWRNAEVLMPVFRSLSPQTRVIVDSIDLHFVRKAREVFHHDHLNGQVHQLDKFYGEEMTGELNIYAAADGVLTISQKETDLANDLLASPHHAHRVPLVGESTASPIPFSERRGILFVGNFHFSPNVEAVEYLLSEILPEIPEHILRDHPISIVGSGLDEKVTKLGKGLNHVRMVGWVPDVTVYLHQARVSVIPLLYGAGIKGKLLNALAAGTPSVSTSIGAEGLGLIPGEHILVADDAVAFAVSIVSLIEDGSLWERLACQGRNHINATYSHEAVRACFTSAIQSILSRVNSAEI